MPQIVIAALVIYSVLSNYGYALVILSAMFLGAIWLILCCFESSRSAVAEAHDYEEFRFKPRRSNGTPARRFERPALSQHDSIRWAASVLANSSSHLIIDTETTGLSGRDEVIEISIIEMNGNKVFHSHIKPPKRRKMPPEAEKVHGISISFLKDKPTLEQVWPGIQAALCGKTLIAYNAEFDERLLRQTCRKYNLQPLGNRWECAMIPYAAWVGEWNDYRNDYKWQKLPSAGHDALSDCLATRKIIIEMAGGRD